MALTSPGSEAQKAAIRPWHQAPATSYFSTSAATRPHADLSQAQAHDEFMVLLASRQPKYFRILAGAPQWKPVHGLSQVASWSLPAPTLPWGVRPLVDSTPIATRTEAGAHRAPAVKPARAGASTSLASVRLPPPAADVRKPDISSEGSEAEASHRRPPRSDAATVLPTSAAPCQELDSLDVPNDAQDLLGCDGQCSSNARGKAAGATAAAAAGATAAAAAGAAAAAAAAPVDPAPLRSLRQVLQGPRSRQQLSQQQRRRAAVAVAAASAQEDYDPVAHLRETQEAWQASMLATQRHSKATQASAPPSIDPSGTAADAAAGHSGQELTGAAQVVIQQCTDMLGKLRGARQHSASPATPHIRNEPADAPSASSTLANPCHTYDGDVAGPISIAQPRGREVVSGFAGEADGSCAQAVAALLAAPTHGSTSSLGGEEGLATRRTSGGPMSPAGSRRGSRSPDPGLSLAGTTPLPVHVDDLLAAMQLDSMVARGSGADTPAASPTPGKAVSHRLFTTRPGLVSPGARLPQGASPLRAQVALCGPQLTGSVGLMGLAVSPMASPRPTNDTLVEAGSEAEACAGDASGAAGHDSGSATVHLQQGEMTRPGSFRGVLQGQDATGSEACQPIPLSPRTSSRNTPTDATIKWLADCQNQTWSDDGQPQQVDHEPTAAQIASERQPNEQQEQQQSPQQQLLQQQQQSPQQQLQQQQQQSQQQQQQQQLSKPQQQPLLPGSGLPTAVHGPVPDMDHAGPVVRASSSDRRRMRVAAAASMAAAAAAAATSAFEVLHRTQPEAAPPMPQRPSMLFRSTTADKALLRPQGLHMPEGHEPPMLYRLAMTPPGASTWEPHASQRAMWAVSSSPCSSAGPQDDATSSTALWRPLVRPGDTAAVAAMWKPVTRSSAPRFASSAVRTVTGIGSSPGVGGTLGALASDVWSHGKRSSMVGGALANHTGVRVDAAWFNTNHHGGGQGGVEGGQRHSAGAKLSSPTSATMTAYALARATAAMQARVP